MELNAIQQAVLLLVALTAIVGYLLYPKHKSHLLQAREKGCQCRAGRIVVWADPDCPVHGHGATDKKEGDKEVGISQAVEKDKDLPPKPE